MTIIYSGCCDWGFSWSIAQPQIIHECPPCPDPDGMARCWKFTMAGLAKKFSCTDCELGNGEFIVVHQSACLFLSEFIGDGNWWDPNFGGGCYPAKDFQWTFNRPGTSPTTGTWSLALRGDASGSGSPSGTAVITFAIYTIPVSSFDCNGPNVLSLSTGFTFQCDGHPATLTIEPADCPAFSPLYLETIAALGEGPGTELKKILEAEGIPSCQACDGTARTMNEIGIDGCLRSIEDLTEAILPRAREWVSLNYAWTKLLPRQAKDFAIRQQIKKHIEQAINIFKEKSPNP